MSGAAGLRFAVGGRPSCVPALRCATCRTSYRGFAGAGGGAPLFGPYVRCAPRDLEACGPYATRPPTSLTLLGRPPRSRPYGTRTSAVPLGTARGRQPHAASTVIMNGFKNTRAEFRSTPGPGVQHGRNWHLYELRGSVFEVVDLGVSADGLPDDVGLAFRQLGPVAKQRPSVLGPGQ